MLIHLISTCSSASLPRGSGQEKLWGSGGDVFIVNKRSSFPMGYLLVVCFWGSSNTTKKHLMFGFFLERKAGAWGQIPARDAMNPCKSVVFLSPLVWEGATGAQCHQMPFLPDNCILSGRWKGWIRRICELLTQDTQLCCHSVTSVSLHFSRGGTSLFEESQGLL